MSEWKMVPVEPTDEMVDAAWESDAVDYVGEHKRICQVAPVYRAMLSAAPQPAVREPYLLGGTRFKLSFNDEGDVSCFANYQVELDGQWVALVDATDGKHIAPQPEQKPVEWMLKTGHGTKIVEVKPPCEVDLWKPLYLAPTDSGREG